MRRRQNPKLHPNQIYLLPINSIARRLACLCLAMKLLAIVYLLGVVATNNASDLFNTKGSSIAETIEYHGRALDDSSEWDLGTKVYKEFDDGWYEGKITGYDGESYTILWSDGVRSTHDEKAVEQMVTVSPQGSKWDLGTKVYKEFDDEGWYEGTITWYDGESYTITWSDGYRYTYGEHEVEQMIADAETGASFIPSPSGFYPVGTFVSKEFGDDWYFGQSKAKYDICSICVHGSICILTSFYS